MFFELKANEAPYLQFLRRVYLSLIMHLSHQEGQSDRKTIAKSQYSPTATGWHCLFTQEILPGIQLASAKGPFWG